MKSWWHKRLQFAPWQRILYIMFFAQLMTAVGFSSIFPFLPLYVEFLGSSLGWSIEILAGLVFSAQAFTMMIASPIWGALADRFGRKIMVERAMFGGAAMLFLMGFVRTGEQLVLLRAIQGLFTGTVAATNALVASSVPRERTGFAMGIIQMGLGTGVALGPVLGGVLADAIGYRASFYVTGGLLFLSGMTVLLGVKENFTKGDDTNISISAFVHEWQSVLQSRGVPIAYGLRFTVRLGRMMAVPYAPLFVAQLMAGSPGVNTVTGLVVGANAAATTVSAIYLGRLGDRSGHRRILVLSTLAAALFYFPQSLVTRSWQLLAMQAMVGVALGGMIPAISALLARYTRAGQEGAVFGLDNSINASARSLAPLLGSAVVLWFDLRTIFTASGILFLLAGLLAQVSLPKPETPRKSRQALDCLPRSDER